MGDVAGLHDSEARVPRDRRLTKRRILKDVGPLRFGEGHDTTFPYALALATGESSDRALMSWTAALRDDTRWSDANHAGSAAFADHAMRSVLVDKRRAAARFLRAAESYGYSADAAAKGGVGAFDGSVAMRFIDAGHRRAWAKNLDLERDNDREAREALASARKGMK